MCHWTWMGDKELVSEVYQNGVLPLSLSSDSLLQRVFALFLLPFGQVLVKHISNQHRNESPYTYQSFDDGIVPSMPCGIYRCAIHAYMNNLVTRVRKISGFTLSVNSFQRSALVRPSQSRVSAIWRAINFKSSSPKVIGRARVLTSFLAGGVSSSSLPCASASVSSASLSLDSSESELESL